MPSMYNLLPTTEKPISTRRRTGPLGLLELAFTSRVKFYGLAILAGVSFQLLFGLVFSPSWRRVDTAPGLGGCAGNEEIWVGARSDVEWTLEDARKMVAQTNGYYTRDYSLNLGWNNVRYIIEAAIYQAKLLNRTLVLPSFVYARSCNYDMNACAAYLPKVHWTEAVHRAEWSDHPFEQEELFRVPIEYVVDLHRLRAGPTQDIWTSASNSTSSELKNVRWPVVTVAEYLHLHGLDPKIELHNGYWDDMYLLKPGTNMSAYTEAMEAEKARVKAEAKAAAAAVGLGGRSNGRERRAGVLEDMRGVSMYEMTNEEWDTVPLVRVDDVRTLKKYDPRSWSWHNRSFAFSGAGAGALPNEKSMNLLHSLNDTLTEASNANPNGQVVLEVEQARRIAKGAGFDEVDGDAGLEKVLGDAGWDFVYTFEGRLNQEFIKSIVWPLTQVAPRAQMRGFVNELAPRTAEIVHLVGEVHLERKAGLMRFTSPSARDEYAQIGLYAMRAPELYWRVAARVASRMKEKCGGRMFMAAHIRRGDFVRFGWTPNESLDSHIRLVRDKLRKGANILADIKSEYAARSQEGPIDEEVANYEPPHEDDPFYIATDDHSMYSAGLMRNLGGVLIEDLLTPEDRTLGGWEMLYSDLVALVEQIVMSRASYWNAHAMSSLAGGVINLRVARGADPRTALLD